MSIRSIDFKILIPKTAEVQKIKHLQTENEKINAQINIKKDAQNQYKSLKKINKSDKLHEFRINKDEKKQNDKGNSKNKEKNKEKQKSNIDKNENNSIKNRLVTSKIDIRI